jgi:hypothetical protein
MTSGDATEGQLDDRTLAETFHRGKSGIISILILAPSFRLSERWWLDAHSALRRRSIHGLLTESWNSGNAATISCRTAQIFFAFSRKVYIHTLLTY